jgi:hypothetical protein
MKPWHPMHLLIQSSNQHQQAPRLNEVIGNDSQEERITGQQYTNVFAFEIISYCVFINEIPSSGCSGELFTLRSLFIRRVKRSTFFSEMRYLKKSKKKKNTNTF